MNAFAYAPYDLFLSLSHKLDSAACSWDGPLDAQVKLKPFLDSNKLQKLQIPMPHKNLDFTIQRMNINLPCLRNKCILVRLLS